MQSDLVQRLRSRSYSCKIPDPLVEEAANEIERLRAKVERLRERVNEFIDAERKYIMEHEPIRYDMNDPIFSEDAYE